ncbi:hypothetical protein EMCRGX_G031806 [Ephydatia muelleri]
MATEPEEPKRREPGNPEHEDDQVAGLQTRPIGAYGCLASVRGALVGWIREELFQLFRLIIPVYLTTVFTQAIFLVSLIFLGQYSGNALEIDAAALAVALINMTGLSVGFGLSSALDTLCSQAFGFKNYKRVGVVVQQGILIIGLSMFPIWALWLNVKFLLVILQQDSCISELTSEYIKTFSVALPGLFLLMILSKYLQAQSIIVVFIVVGFMTNVVNITLHAVFLYGLNMGFKGAVYAMTLSQSAAPLFLLAAMWAWGLHKQTWGGWSWESLVDWWTFTKLAIPGLFMVGFEWWSYEVGAVVVGTIDKTQLGIYTIVLNVNAFLFMNALAIGIAVSIRVGNFLGSDDPLKAKRVFYMTIVITLIEVTIFAVGLQLLKYKLGSLFTTDVDIQNGIAHLLDIVTPFMYFDHLQGALGGVIRGSGKQLFGAISNFVSFYIIGLPIGIALALAAHLGAFGLWIGLMCGAAVQTAIYITVILRMDWKKQCKLAIKRAQAEAEEYRRTVGREPEDLSVVYETTSCGKEEREGVLGEKEDEEGGNAETDSKTSLKTADMETEGLDTKDSNILVSKITFHSKPRLLKVKLFLYRSAFFLGGFAILVAGGIASRFSVYLDMSKNSTNCSSSGH